MKTLTIFTPTFNRAELLERCFNSLQRQTNKDFIWFVIDDGSTDNTKEVVQGWVQKEESFEIKYFHKENGGLHTAYNMAIEYLETELAVCIDSDDYMPDDAVEKILNFWKEKGSDKYAGIVGLDCDLGGKVIGDKLPDINAVNLIGLLTGKYNIVNGDRTNIVRSELYKKIAPMKVFDGEKNFNPHYMHLQISMEYDFLVMNEIIRIVDYQTDGMSHSIFKQYKNSPNSFIEIRKLYLSFPDTKISFKVKNTIHLISSCILAKKPFDAIRISMHPALSLLLFPFGFALFVLIKIKTIGYCD